MKRRDILATMLGAAMVPAVGSQHASAPRRVTILTYLPDYAARFESAMRALGWTQKTLQVEASVVAGPQERVEREAARIVATRPDVIVGRRSTAVVALAQATRTIPIVSAGMGDPIGEGVARSLSRPGGNVTGLSLSTPEVAALQLRTMREVAPGLRRLVFVSADPELKGRLPSPQSRACAALGVDCRLDFADTRARFEAAVAGVRADAGEAVWIGDLPAGVAAREIAAVALRGGVPSFAQNAAAVDDGLLLSVWLRHVRDVERTAAIVDRILRGADPGTIPFELPETSVFRLNRATARALGLQISQELLLRVTELVG